MAIAKVKTTPAGATLYLDGRKLEAVSPATLDAIEANQEHVLLAQLDGYDDALVHFTLNTGEVRALDVPLQKPAPGKQAKHEKPKNLRPRPRPVVATPAPAPVVEHREPVKPEAPVRMEGEGTLVIASSPWCNVSIDGVNKGPTPVSAKLPAGKHVVLLTNPEFKISRTLPVTVMPGETLRKKLDFAQ
jgi:hypothetical protein